MHSQKKNKNKKQLPKQIWFMIQQQQCQNKSHQWKCWSMWVPSYHQHGHGARCPSSVLRLFSFRIPDGVSWHISTPVHQSFYHLTASMSEPLRGSGRCPPHTPTHQHLQALARVKRRGLLLLTCSLIWMTLADTGSASDPACILPACVLLLCLVSSPRTQVPSFVWDGYNFYSVSYPFCLSVKNIKQIFWYDNTIIKVGRLCMMEKHNAAL